MAIVRNRHRINCKKINLKSFDSLYEAHYQLDLYCENYMALFCMKFEFYCIYIVSCDCSSQIRSWFGLQCSQLGCGNRSKTGGDVFIKITGRSTKVSF